MPLKNIGQKSAAFINHKPFHPGSYRNLEKVWVAEQKAEEAQRRDEELQKRRDNEGKMLELRRALRARDNGNTMGTAFDTLENEDRHKLDWMYAVDNNRSMAGVDANKFEAGGYAGSHPTSNPTSNALSNSTSHPTSKPSLPAPDIPEKEDGRKEGSDEDEKEVLAEMERAAGLVRDKELEWRAKEDPMMVVKKAEAHELRALASNPLIRARLEAELDAEEAEERKARSLGKERRALRRERRKLDARVRELRELEARLGRREAPADSDSESVHGADGKGGKRGVFGMNEGRARSEENRGRERAEDEGNGEDPRPESGRKRSREGRGGRKRRGRKGG